MALVVSTWWAGLGSDCACPPSPGGLGTGEQGLLQLHRPWQHRPRRRAVPEACGCLALRGLGGAWTGRAFAMARAPRGTSRGPTDYGLMSRTRWLPIVAQGAAALAAALSHTSAVQVVLLRAALPGPLVDRRELPLSGCLAPPWPLCGQRDPRNTHCYPPARRSVFATVLKGSGILLHSNSPGPPEVVGDVASRTSLPCTRGLPTAHQASGGKPWPAWR